MQERMKVKVGNRLYEMSKKEAKAVLAVASEQVSFGIYAVEKGDYLELLNHKATSKTQFKKDVRTFENLGFKVYKNGR